VPATVPWRVLRDQHSERETIEVVGAVTEMELVVAASRDQRAFATTNSCDASAGASTLASSWALPTRCLPRWAPKVSGSS